MRYFKETTTGTVHGYDEQISAYAPYIQKAINNNWQEITGQWPPAETKDQAIARLTPSVTSAINDAAKSWGYDSIESAISYMNSTNPTYAIEAKLLNEWRDIAWAWAIPALAAVQPGETVGQFLASMPELPSKPAST